jgi:DNA invertase Pin-like site-specific DNA recombinase
VRSGLAAAKAKGKRLGRPRVDVDVEKIASLRAAGASWRTISREMKLSIGKLYEAFHERS